MYDSTVLECMLTCHTDLSNYPMSPKSSELRVNKSSHVQSVDRHARALLPEIVRFAYIPANDHRIHDQAAASSSKRGGSPDLYAPTPHSGHSEEHVLVMEFSDNISTGLSAQKKVYVRHYSLL